MSSNQFIMPHAPRRPPAPQGFDLEDLLRTFHARRGLIALVTMGTVLLAVVFAFSLPTVWSSSAVVMLDTRKNTIADSSAVLTQLQPDPATLQNQIQILTSRELAQTVITNLKLYEDPEFNTALAAPGLADAFLGRSADGAAPAGTEKAHDAIMENFLRQIWAEPNGVSTAITVGARSRDPVKATRIANALVEAYVNDQLDNKHDAGAQTAAWLQTRVDDLSRQLQGQNEDIQRFKARNGIADTAPGTSLADQQMAAISAQLVQARADLSQKMSVQQQLQRPGADQSSAAPVLASQVITALRAQQAELGRQEADLSSKYGPLYPKLQAVQAQRREIDGKIGQEVARIAAGADTDVTVARGQLDALQSSLAGARQQAVNQNMARSQLSGLESNATSTRTAYESFVQKLRAAQDQDGALTPESRVISPASVPSSPSSPKRKLIVGASLPLGLMLGMLTALLLEKFGYLLRPRARQRNGGNRGRAARRMGGSAHPGWSGPPILGEIANAATLKAADYVIDWPDSRFAHASAALVRQLEPRGGEGAVLALTASEPGDAKSVVAISLARAAAAMGKKAIIIDCDPAHRTAAALHADATAGLAEVLNGTVPLNDALVRDPRGSAYLLTLKQRPAAAMFASPQMARLLEILRDACDFVVLDCGPALSGPETALIARQADATLLVSRREKLAGRQMAHATQALQNARAAPIGLVLAG